MSVPNDAWGLEGIYVIELSAPAEHLIVEGDTIYALLETGAVWKGTRDTLMPQSEIRPDGPRQGHPAPKHPFEE